MSYNNVKGEIIGFNSSLTKVEAKSSTKRGTVFFTTDGKIVLCGNEYGGLNAEEVESVATELLEQYDEVWSASLNDLESRLRDDKPDIFDIFQFEDETTPGGELPYNAFYVYNDLPIEDVRQCTKKVSANVLKYFIIFKVFNQTSKKYKYIFFSATSTDELRKYTYQSTQAEEDLSDSEKYMFGVNTLAKFRVDQLSVGDKLPEHSFIPFILYWPCEIYNSNNDTWFYQKNHTWLYKCEYNSSSSSWEFKQRVGIDDVSDEIKKEFGLDVHDRLDALETDNTNSKGRLEALEGASGKTANSLKFGTKSFDGSSEQTITASDLGIDNPWHVEGSVDGDYDTYTTEGRHILKKGNDFILVDIVGENCVTNPDWGTGDGAATLPNNNPPKGSIVLYNNKEFWWNGTNWSELGDEGSFALKTNTYTKSETDGIASTAKEESNAYTDSSLSSLYLNSENPTGTKVSVSLNRAVEGEDADECIDTVDLPVATSEKAGVISAADRAQIYANKSNIENVYTKNDVYTKTEINNTPGGKLDEIYNVVQSNNVKVQLLDSSDSVISETQIPSATNMKAGVMSAADKEQLENNTTALRTYADVVSGLTNQLVWD